MMTRIKPVVWGLVILAISVAARGDEPPGSKPIARVVEGRVVDEHGSPVAGAMVLVRPTRPPFPKDATARTNADGRYRFESSQVDWANSEVQLMVLAPGFAYALVPAVPPSRKAAAEIKLKAEAWKTTEMRLADQSGRPAAGVELTCSIVEMNWSRLKTDATGLCRIAMAIGVPVRLEAKPTGARPINLNLVNGKDDPETIKLPVLEPIRGRVHDAEGKPLSGISIGRLISVNQGKPMVYPHSRGSTSTTDSDGRFELAPAVVIDSHDLDHPGRYRFPSSICFVDQDLKHAAFRLVDFSSNVEPLDVTLEPVRPVRIPIELDPGLSTPEPMGRLTASLSPRADIPEFHPLLLTKNLPTANLRDEKRAELLLPGGKYFFEVECYDAKAEHQIGKAEREMVVPPGDGPVDLPALRIEVSPHLQMVGKPAPDIDATDRDTGRPVHLADFRGKVVVLDFWGYWCGPCNGAMPYLADLHRRFEGRPVAVVGLHDQSVQSRPEYDRRTAFARRYFWEDRDLPFRVLFDRPDPDKASDRQPEGTGATCRRYGIVAFPTLFVIDQQGTLVATLRRTEHERLESLIHDLLEKSPDQRAETR